MNIDEIIKRVTIKEKNNEEKNESFSVSDLEEKYNNLYSNFEVKERKNDFLESMNKKNIIKFCQQISFNLLNSTFYLII